MSWQHGRKGRGGGGSGRRDDGPRSLPHERLVALREWVRDGGPDDPEVLDAIARRMLSRGDL